MSLSQKIDGIELKVRQLSLKMERLEQENAQLLEENKQLNTKLTEQSQKIGVLKGSLAKKQEALEVKRADEHKDLGKIRKQLDHYIAEIDECIEWLQNV